MIANSDTIHLLFQIKNLYDSNGCYGLYDLVYDRVKKDGHDMRYSADELKIFWEKAKIRFSKEHPTWIKGMNVKDKKGNIRFDPPLSEEQIKKEITRIFKSMLVAKYLMDKVESEGCLIITDEQGNKLEIPQPFR